MYGPKNVNIHSFSNVPLWDSFNIICVGAAKSILLMKDMNYATTNRNIQLKRNTYKTSTLKHEMQNILKGKKTHT